MSKSKFPAFIVVILLAWLLSTVAFVVLKCLGILTLSWWWLLVPIFGLPILSIMAVGIIAVCVIFITATSKNIKPL